MRMPSFSLIIDSGPIGSGRATASPEKAKDVALTAGLYPLAWLLHRPMVRGVPLAGIVPFTVDPT